MPLNMHHDALAPFESANTKTRTAAFPVLELLSTGFQITRFKETAPLLWLAVVKPNQEVGEHFGLRRECFVIGNGYHNDFQQKTLKESPPEALLDRLEPAVRFVASDAPIAEAFCAAWAQQNRATIVLFKGVRAETSTLENLYSILSASLWRRDFFAESEPVKDPAEFFGREAVVNELFTKIILGTPIAIFGLRKIGKSSLLGRVEDLACQDKSSVTATAFAIGNSTRLKTGRWWHLAQDMLTAWQNRLQQFAKQNGSKVVAKAERLHALISKREASHHVLAVAFERDILTLLKAARALKEELGRDPVLFCFMLYSSSQVCSCWPSLSRPTILELSRTVGTNVSLSNRKKYRIAPICSTPPEIFIL